MKVLRILIKKDIQNAKQSFAPSLLLGLPLLLLLALSDEIEPLQALSWRTSLWFSFFFSSTALLYRSFGLENRNRNFALYTSLRISHWKILFSQCLINAAALVGLGLIYYFLVQVFWTPADSQIFEILPLLIFSSLALSPVGSLLGLILQSEREVLFPFFYLPFASPVIIGSHSLSFQNSQGWLYIMGIFLVGGLFLSFWIFEFFFDELTQVE